MKGGALCVIPVLAAALAGCSKSGSTGPAGGTPGVITVAGKVIGQNGQGAAGIPVFVPGMPSTNTDASGGFAFTGVSTPYDITVVDAAHKRALVYKSLTRTDPTLLFLSSFPGTSHSGAINGRISGGTFTPNQGANDVTGVLFASPEVSSSLNTAVNGLFGPLNLTWYGPAVTTGTLYALQYTVDANGLPVASGYHGYGTLPGIAVNDGSTLNNRFDTLQAVPTTQFTGSVTVPAGYTLASKLLGVKFAPYALITVISDATPNAALSYFTPSIPGATLLLTLAAAQSGNITYYFKPGIAPGAQGVAVSLAAAPGLSLPVNAATAVDTSVTFTWTAMPGAVHLIQFSAGSSYPGFIILTAGTSARIPNLKSLGLGLPSSITYQWSVTAVGPFAAADDAAGSAGLFGALNDSRLLTSDAFLGSSSARTFTTAP